MADLGLVKQLVDAGHDRDAAFAAVDAVTSAIVAQLRADKAVGLAGIGTLRAPETVARAPIPPGKLRTQRKVTLRRPELVAVGQPYDDPDYVPKKRSTYSGGRY